MPDLLGQQRENWGTRAAFVLAAIGSAVGLGNLWGFPYKLYSYGGGAFLVPYVLAMVLIGVPVLILEFSLGHMTQRAGPDAFRGTNRRSEFVGWWGILLGFVIITYYAVVLAWCLSFLGDSVAGLFDGGKLPWAAEAGEDGVKKASDYFLYNYLNSYTSEELGSVKPWALGGLVGKIVVSLAIVWVLLYLCIFRGVKLVSRIVIWTVPLPWLMLIILTIRGLTLEGAASGLEFYLRPEWSELAKPTTWRFAFGQVFFSMSLAFGVMVTYASFLHRKSDLNNNAAIIGLGDLGTSFIAGIAIFATLGGMSVAAGVPVKDVAHEGGGLAFIAFPYALAQLPHAAWFSTVFFFALITLGIDSAFSITESILAAIVDKTGWSRHLVLIALTGLGFGIGLVYCTRAGDPWITAMDLLINGPWGIALLGMLECLVLGWMYRISRLRHHANERSDWKLGPWWDWLIRVVVPVLLAALFVWSLFDQLTNTKGYLYGPDGELVLTDLVGLIVAAAAPLLAVLLSLIHSPGGDRHAAHVGQPVGPRTGGKRGTVLALISLACLGVGFALCWKAQLDKNADGLTDGVWHTVGQARLVLMLGGLTALSGLILGAAGVVGAERRNQRPSKWARAAAALSVIATGSTAGMLLALWVMGLKLAETRPTYGSTLSGASYAVAAVMIALIVCGLFWCFYRALKAAGTSEPPQLAEGLEE